MVGRQRSPLPARRADCMVFPEQSVCSLVLILSRDSHGKHHCLSEDSTPRNPSEPEQLLLQAGGCCFRGELGRGGTVGGRCEAWPPCMVSPPSRVTGRGLSAPSLSESWKQTQLVVSRRSRGELTVLAQHQDPGSPRHCLAAPAALGSCGEAGGPGGTWQARTLEASGGRVEGAPLS